jgi:hypothetical protein
MRRQSGPVCLLSVKPAAFGGRHEAGWTSATGDEVDNPRAPATAGVRFVSVRPDAAKLQAVSRYSGDGDGNDRNRQAQTRKIRLARRSQMKNTVLFLFLIFASWFFGSASASDRINACSVITHAEAEQAADVELAEGRLTEYEAIFMQGTTLCHFESRDTMRYKSFVSIELTVAESEDDAATRFNDAVYLILSPEEIKGIGEKTVWGGDPFQPKGGLHVLQGKYYFEVKVNREDGKKNLEQAKTLAEKILERLQ